VDNRRSTEAVNGVSESVLFRGFIISKRKIYMTGVLDGFFLHFTVCKEKVKSACSKYFCRTARAI
jgi:hypothetical protein